jgi:thiamine pyrophosphokinase
MGIDIQVYRSEKNFSDGEIALKLALSKGCKNIVITGGKDGRCDHILSTLLLPYITDSGATIEIWINGEIIHSLRSGSKREFFNEWKVVSIIPLSDECTISTDGLRWPLRSERMDRGSTRGIHNEPVADIFSIECEAGSVLVVLSNQV